MHGRRRRRQSGSALVELAIALPMMILIVGGTIDFARVFYTAHQLTNAARAGAQYGAASLGNSNNASKIQATASAAAPNIGTITVPAPTLLCRCASPAGAFSAAACTANCGANHLVVTVTVSANKTFTMITPLPGLSPLTINRTATLRVAN